VVIFDESAMPRLSSCWRRSSSRIPYWSFLQSSNEAQGAPVWVALVFSASMGALTVASFVSPSALLPCRRDGRLVYGVLVLTGVAWTKKEKAQHSN